MSHSIFIDRHRRALEHDPMRPHAEIEREHQRRLLLVATLGLMCGALAFSAFEQAIGRGALALPANSLATARRVSDVAVEGPELEFPTRELPREWQWEPRPLDVEFMHMRKPAPGPNWIRAGESR